MKPENRNQMVRGVVVAGTSNSSLFTTDPIQAEQHDCCVAKTFWYRHDELDEVEHALKMLCQAYRNMYKYSSMMVAYEYKDYKR